MLKNYRVYNVDFFRSHYFKRPVRPRTRRTSLHQTTEHIHKRGLTVYQKKYAHGFVVPCFVVVMQSFIMNSHEVFIHIHQGCFAGTGAIVRLPQCQWSKPDGYGKISQCITTTKHSKAKTVCIFLGIYCMCQKGTSDYIPQYLCDVVTCPCPWYLFMALKSSYGIDICPYQCRITYHLQREPFSKWSKL